MPRFQLLMPRVATSMLSPFAFACLVAVASLGWTGWAAAAACSSSSYWLNTQAEVDALGATGCDSVSGSLNIWNSSNITNVDGLANLISVGGNLYIASNSNLVDLDGLANLAEVGVSLGIYYNPSITNLDGLSNISAIGGDLGVGNNAALTNLDGLSNLTNINGFVGIESNDALTNLDGLANLTSVGAYLYILDTEALTNLNGLANLTSVGTNLAISRNDALTNIDGLANLTSVGGRLSISQNNALTNLNGLANLASVWELFIEFNPNATSCEGLAPLLGWPNGGLFDNVAGGIINIRGNGLGCGSTAEILASVSGPTKPTITSASATSGGFSLTFSSSTTPDAPFPITGYEAACIGSSADLSEAPAASLLDNTPVARTLTVSGYDPVSVLSDIEVDIDITHRRPDQLRVTLTTPQGTELVLWDQDGSGTEDIAGTFPTTLTPIDMISSVGRQAMDGNWVLRVEDVEVGPLVREGVLNTWGLRISETVTATGSSSPIMVNGFRGRDYSCTVAPVTGLGTLPVSDAVTVNVPLELPATPTVTSTDYEDGTIRLTVSVADNGGADITEYAATCTDGTNAFTGTSSTPTIEVTGLTNGTAYTCTASATNVVGSSGASAPTESITPEEPSAGLPIWLLYEATK